MWDYPRPPSLERVDSHIVVRFADTMIAETRRAFVVKETSLVFLLAMAAGWLGTRTVR